jgi:hypothetical protein
MERHVKYFLLPIWHPTKKVLKVLHFIFHFSSFQMLPIARSHFNFQDSARLSANAPKTSSLLHSTAALPPSYAQKIDPNGASFINPPCAIAFPSPTHHNLSCSEQNPFPPFGHFLPIPSLCSNAGTAGFDRQAPGGRPKLRHGHSLRRS